LLKENERRKSKVHWHGRQKEDERGGERERERERENEMERKVSKRREEIFQQRGINYDQHQLRVINYNVDPITRF